MRGLNPFGTLTRQLLSRVLEDRRVRAATERRLHTLLTSYEDLIQDSRYKDIRQELTLITGDYLRQLVETARQCAHCSAAAERVTLMQKVVAEPLEEVWFARAKEEDAPVPEEDGVEAVVG